MYFTAGNDAWLTQALATSSFGSWLRVVSAPYGLSTGLQLSFSVEGVASSSAAPLDVQNLDPPGSFPVDPASQCAYLDIVAWPTKIIVTGASLAAFSTPFDRPFTVVAYNAYGDPVSTPRVAMFLYDSAGIHVYRSKLGAGYSIPCAVSNLPLPLSAAADTPSASFSAMSQAYQNYLAQSGGGLAFALGNNSAVAFGQLLHAPIHTVDSDIQGVASFTDARIAAAHNTFARCVTCPGGGSCRMKLATVLCYAARRYVFVALQTTPQDPNTFDASAVSACYSQVSPPIPIVGSLASIAWVAPPLSSDITCVADGLTAITPTPLAAAFYANGSAVPSTSADATYVLLSAIDGTFATYPAHVGVTSRVLQPSVPTGILGVPLIRSPLDVAASPLLNANGDNYIMGSLNP